MGVPYMHCLPVLASTSSTTERLPHVGGGRSAHYGDVRRARGRDIYVVYRCSPRHQPLSDHRTPAADGAPAVGL